MKYAVIQTGGKQYKVAEGDIIEIERIQASPNDTFGFSDVLLIKDDNLLKIGNPYLPDVKVSGVVVEHKRGDKIRVAKYKAKARYRRVTGYRQSLTKMRIDTIFAGNAKSKRDEGISAEEKSTVKRSKTRTSRKIIEKTA